MGWNFNIIHGINSFEVHVSEHNQAFPLKFLAFMLFHPHPFTLNDSNINQQLGIIRTLGKLNTGIFSL